MIRLFVTLCIIAALSTVGIADNNVPKFFGEKSGKVKLPLPIDKGKLKEITLTTSSNDFYIIYVSNDSNDLKKTNYTHNKIQLSSNYLSISDLNKSDTGEWSIQITREIFIDENGNNVYNIYYNTDMNKLTPKIIEKSVTYYVEVFEEITELEAIPSSRISVFPNNTISAYFPDVITHMTNCTIHDNKNFEHNMSTPEGRLENMELINKCGVKMVVNSTHNGWWQLIAHRSNNRLQIAKFLIDVKNPMDYEPTHEVVHFYAGARVNIVTKKSVVYCELEDPHGKKYGVQYGECSYQIGHITKYHEGIWKATYAVGGSDQLIVDTITVVLRNEETVNETITINKNGSIHLLCSMYSSPLSYCNFVRPDKLVMNMISGVGNDEYAYFLPPNSHDDKDRRECGVTIFNPKPHDYGSWQCHLRSNIYHAPIVGSILRIEKRNNDHRTYNVTARDVAVKVAEPFLIKCNVDAKLTYCWLKSPNGTAYAVSPTGNFPKSLKYSGVGYKFGECSAEIPEASQNDSGTWTCHLGISGSTEKVVPFNVDVLDYRLMAEKSHISANKLNEARLRCSVLPDQTDSIEFCRWISPKGRGINTEHGGHYITEKHTMNCDLTITRLENDDFGTWTCYARLSGIIDEQLATIVIDDTFAMRIAKYALFMPCVMLPSFLIIITALMAYIYVEHRRRTKASNAKMSAKQLNQEQISSNKQDKMHNDFVYPKQNKFNFSQFS